MGNRCERERISLIRTTTEAQRRCWPKLDEGADGGGDLEGVGDVVGEAEADTTNGMDHLGAGSGLVELAVQVRKVNIHHMAVADPLGAPHRIEQIFTGAHFGRAAAELLEQSPADQLPGRDPLVADWSVSQAICGAAVIWGGVRSCSRLVAPTNLALLVAPLPLGSVELAWN